MRLVVLAVLAILVFSFFGCTDTQPAQAPQNQPTVQPKGPGPDYTILNTTDATGTGTRGSAGTDTAVGTGAGAGTATNTASDSQLREWKSPDGALTLQLPKNWQATEKQVDNCTANWAVTDPAGTSSAYMNNQIMIFKSEDAKKMYQAYGMSGIEGVPVADYLGAEAAVQQIIAPLTGASEVHITYNDEAMSKQFSQTMCIAGVAACDAKVFEAAYKRNGVLMRGEYMMQTIDMGDGFTWWIHIWGYTSPAADWNTSAPLLERIFASAKYTDAWTARCGGKTVDPSAIINEVVKERQGAQDKAAAGWDNYISGG